MMRFLLMGIYEQVYNYCADVCKIVFQHVDCLFWKSGVAVCSGAVCTFVFQTLQFVCLGKHTIMCGCVLIGVYHPSFINTNRSLNNTLYMYIHVHVQRKRTFGCLKMCSV